MRMKFAAALVALLSLSSPCFAQTPPATTTPGTGAADKVAVPIWPVSTVALPEQAVPASFSLGQIEGVDPALLSGVTAKGFARKVAVENQSIGQILVMSVAKGEREETISTEGLTAQFDAKDTNQLFPEKTMEVSGSKSALVAALERLAAPKADDKEKREIKDDVSENPASGSGGNNSEAAGYKTPTVTAAPANEEKEPVTEYRTSTDNCPVRIDMVQGTAVQQNKIQTFTDGALTNDGECTDGAPSYPLKKSYLSCPVDVVDLATMKAWPQYSLYYIDDAGENHPVGECVQDTETVYTITEDEAQCPIFLDFTDGKAVPQAAFVYINRNNSTVQARGCENSTKSAALTMTESAANCPLRHDFAGGRSYELSMWTYLRGGVTYQGAPCTDTGRSFVQEVVYADAGGNNICPAITNMTTKTAILQSRRRITVDGVPQFVTECTPDTATTAILSTTDGCMDPSKWTHDLAANISYGQERFYYLKAGGSREYVTTCQTSAVSYPHSVTITGYQHHDDQLWAYPLMTVTITVNGSPYTIASSQVLPGAAQMVYQPNGTTDKPSGSKSYDGCNAYSNTTRFERWTRPDETEFLKDVGAGTPVGPTWACTYSGGSNVSDWPMVAGSEWWAANDPWDQNDLYASYRATRIAVRDDGTTVSSQTATKTFHCGHDYDGKGNPAGTNPTCPSYPTSSAVSSWRAELGW
ncbi:conserved protein of unknown function [Magnetospirillum gryphiswaldense MSR-1 v2]|uniref:Secreted protein n=3 Tax=Magnetospirillum gryphiswaldense TaxID=55518 RepID=V6F5Q8_MAGGM|nr:hypothetical protein [Magnetospirillum gryphiswaldense]CAM78255.1 secreted protein [Magnetospirillum gryphiswaldense MSR-1]CDK99666.1 conserved protein of unknown function [Magnetospirillum gryphiswaldense MSR-1 v2]